MEGLRKEEMVEKRDDLRKPVEQFLKAVDELQLKDITEFASEIISKPLKMVLSVPIYDTVSSKFC
ncbi:hypothetical protein DY000_02010399 [Brassica cretica]|uniref:Uncharacterized protein n=1 Tax=Brassica cretica TaxID=69181 RepID=A0ABQ7BT38_BRACR|nr:hypothetical protein DY000_02010399 [Brassica cretica]